MSEANQESGATNIDGAAARISGLFSSEPKKPTDEPTQPEPSEAATAAEDEGEAEPEQPKYRVKVNGEELEVPIDELTKGYMMGKDYSQKTMALSEQRKQIEAEKEEIGKKLEDAKSLLEMDIDWFESDEAKELREYDPDAYLKQKDKIERRVKKFEKLREDHQKAMAEKHKALLAKEQELLRTAVPDWIDESVVQKEIPNIIKTMKSVGYTDDELNSTYDHRMMVLARKAALYDAIQSQDLSDKKDRTPPKSARPSTQKGSADIASNEAKKLRQRLKESGSVKDAAALFSSKLR